MTPEEKRQYAKDYHQAHKNEPDYKAKRAKVQQTPEQKAKALARKQTPEYKAKAAARAKERQQNDPEYKARKAEAQRRYRGTAAGLETERKHHNSEKYKEQQVQYNRTDSRKASLLRYRAKTYGLTEAEAVELLALGCGACSSFENLCIDHDHKTGRVRGCLCGKCNSAYGLLGDSPEGVRGLLAYAENTTI
jgi:hypothetical protein